MSRPVADIPKKSRRPCRQFDGDFKAQAVRLVLDERKTAGAVARDLDLTETTLRNWVKQAQADPTHGRTGLTTAERDELARLRKENRVLREEREILAPCGTTRTTSPAGRGWSDRAGLRNLPRSAAGVAQEPPVPILRVFQQRDTRIAAVRAYGPVWFARRGGR